MTDPPYGDYWMQKGRKEGRDEGQRQLLLGLLEHRFGPLTPAVQERLQTWSGERLLQMGKALFQAQSLRELGLEE